MRMFLVGMTDIFLLLYLTAITSVQPGTFLTVSDFYKLKSMHQQLVSEKQRSDERLNEQLRRQIEAKEMLTAKLDQEKGRLDDMQKTLLDSNSERERINQDLRLKEDMLKAREQLLEDMNQQIATKEADWQKIKDTYKQELEHQKVAVEATRKRARVLEAEAKDARVLADQMQLEADQAHETADMAQAVKVRALRLQVKALDEKREAERRAQEALAAREKAEAEKQKALEAMQEANAQKKQVEQKARILAATIDEIKQDGETAYQDNIHPRLQTLNVTWKRAIADNITVYDRELTLLPVTIGSTVYAVFPSRQIGFTGRSDKLPDGLKVMYGKQKISVGLFNKEEDLLAITLPGYDGHADEPYPLDTAIFQLMPALLALRNNGNISIQDKIRGISDDFFIVNRDYLEPQEDRSLKFAVTGFRGTGLRAERIVRGDQLVDLNGRLIGVANTANHIIRIESLEGWEDISFNPF
jgi:hypothetical protein